MLFYFALRDEQVESYIFCTPTGQEEGLVGYWNFNEGSGDTVYDLSGNGNHGVIYGAEFNEDVPESYNGCTDANALNYDSAATHDDASCEYYVPSMLEPASGSVIGLSEIDSLNPLTFTWEPLYPSSLVGEGFYYIYFSTDSNDLEGSMTIFASAATDSLNWSDEGALEDLYLESGYGAGDEFT